ncbi:MAG: hypothetical protein KME09_00110 [Pleurocapsa minor HA4230-MV1]|jgi:hypothetical protein|nr:hypothetical protein [Pleurocapsa minor HA4230-MV1]
MYHTVDSPDTRIQPINLQLQDLLNNWRYVVAKRVVEQWHQTATDFKFGEPLLNSLNLTNQQSETSFDILQKKLKLKVWQTKESTNFKDFNLNSNQLLFNYLDDAIQEIKLILQNARTKNTEAMQQLISLDWQQSSSSQLTLFFDSLLKKLIAQKNIFENNRKIYQEYETSAWQSFFILNQKLQKVAVDSVQYNNITDCKWKAIFAIFEAQLKATYYQIYLDALQNLIERAQTYYDLLIQSSRILEQLQESLNKKYDLAFQIKSLPAFMYLDTNMIDAIKYKKSLENWIGHSINYWGYSSISWQQIETKLLEDLEPIVLDIYVDFRQFFILS